MARWYDLGEITPVIDWTNFNLSTEGELFRFVQTWRSTDYFKPRGLIAQNWGGDLLDTRRLYGRNGTDMIEFKIPRPYRLTGILSRSIAVRLTTPYHPVDISYQWTIEAQVFDPEIPLDRTFRNEFNQGDLTGDSITIVHHLGTDPADVTVWHPNGDQVIPDNVSILDENTIEVDLDSYTPLDGDWSIIVEGD